MKDILIKKIDEFIKPIKQFFDENYIMDYISMILTSLIVFMIVATIFKTIKEAGLNEDDNFTSDLEGMIDEHRDKVKKSLDKQDGKTANSIESSKNDKSLESSKEKEESKIKSELNKDITNDIKK